MGAIARLSRLPLLVIAARAVCKDAILLVDEYLSSFIFMLIDHWAERVLDLAGILSDDVISPKG